MLKFQTSCIMLTFIIESFERFERYISSHYLERRRQYSVSAKLLISDECHYQSSCKDVAKLKVSHDTRNIRDGRLSLEIKNEQSIVAVEREFNYTIARRSLSSSTHLKRNPSMLSLNRRIDENVKTQSQYSRSSLSIKERDHSTLKVVSFESISRSEAQSELSVSFMKLIVNINFDAKAKTVLEDNCTGRSHK